MKITELQKLIREEVKKIVNESTMNGFQPTILDRTNQIDNRIFKKALTENTDITNYYKDYSKEVKNAAKIVKDIISKMDMRVSQDTELYDAIIELVNAYAQDYTDNIDMERDTF